MRGYYSIIQYCPDASRLEAVNYGVALFCPEAGYLEAKFGQRKTRVERALGKQDWELVEAERAALEARLKRREEDFRDLASLEDFIARRAGSFRLTAARPVRVEDPAAELDQLFARLVSSPRSQAAGRRRRFAKQLAEQFAAAGVAGKLKPAVTVAPPLLPKPFRAPFAYQNGRLNLIEPVEFAGLSEKSVFTRASQLAVEGKVLEEYRDPVLGELGLIVVSQFAPGQERQELSTATLLERHGVKMHAFGRLEGLIAEIGSA